MAVYYLDSSALVKRYVRETGTHWLTGLTDSGAGHACWVSTVTAVELVAAFYGRVKSGLASFMQAQQAEQQWRAEFALLFPAIPVQDAVINRAMSLAAQHQLRAYDALQLATCLELRQQCLVMQHPLPQLLSADQELNQAAAAEGLAVDDPNLHP